jgi:hypothetical protein
MASAPAARHLTFAELLKERAPPGIDVISEVVLSTEPALTPTLLEEAGLVG